MKGSDSSSSQPNNFELRKQLLQEYFSDEKKKEEDVIRKAESRQDSYWNSDNLKSSNLVKPTRIQKENKERQNNYRLGKNFFTNFTKTCLVQDNLGSDRDQSSTDFNKFYSFLNQKSKSEISVTNENNAKEITKNIVDIALTFCFLKAAEKSGLTLGQAHMVWLNAKKDGGIKNAKLNSENKSTIERNKALRFSRIFQEETAKMEIFSGRNSSYLTRKQNFKNFGLRLTFISENTFEFIEKYESESQTTKLFNSSSITYEDRESRVGSSTNPPSEIENTTNFPRKASIAEQTTDLSPSKTEPESPEFLPPTPNSHTQPVEISLPSPLKTLKIENKNPKQRRNKVISDQPAQDHQTTKSPQDVSHRPNQAYKEEEHDFRKRNPARETRGNELSHLLNNRNRADFESTPPDKSGSVEKLKNDKIVSDFLSKQNTGHSQASSAIQKVSTIEFESEPQFAPLTLTQEYSVNNKLDASGLNSSNFSQIEGLQVFDEDDASQGPTRAGSPTLFENSNNEEVLSKATATKNREPNPTFYPESASNLANNVLSPISSSKISPTK